MGIQDIIAIGIVLAAALWCIRRLRRATKTGGCNCGCGRQAGATPSGQDDRTGLKRVPLVPTDQIGLPSTTPNREETKQPASVQSLHHT